MLEVTLRQPIANVFELIIFAQIRTSIICGVQIFSIETEDNCEEPDSPLYGQHVWNRNDSVATFQCDDNFTLTSSVPRNCVDGKWIGPQPKCKCFIHQDTPSVDSGEVDNIPVIIGVPVAIILLIVVVTSAIIYKKKLCSKILLQLNHRKWTLLELDELRIS